MITNLLAVAAGGAVGAMLRFLNHKAFAAYFPNHIYLSTFLVNVLGCFLLGLAYAWFSDKYQMADNLRLFIMIGLLGALTTWSTFSMETVLMFSYGQFLKGAAYLFLTVFFCLSACFVGIRLAS